MANSEDKPSHTRPATPELVESWMEAVRQATETAGQMPNQVAAGRDPRVWRRQWLDTLTQTTEAYLRSPLFLQMLKASIDTLAGNQSKLRPRPAASTEDRPLSQDIKAMRRRLQQLRQQLGLTSEHSEELRDERSEVSRSPTPSTAQGTPVAEEPPISGPRHNDTNSDDRGRASHARRQGATPSELVYSEGTLRLLRYPSTRVKFAEPILVCFALVNRPYILDLQTRRSVVQRLLEQGFEVYMIDWGVPSDEDHGMRLEDYVCNLLNHVVDFIRSFHGVSQLNLLGYCMGGTLATMFTALNQDRIKNLVLMAAPIDFAGDKGLLYLWSREEYFDVDKLIDAFGNCPGEFLQFVFQLMKPVQNFAEKQLTFCEHMGDAAFVDSFMAVEGWANDCIPVAGEAFRQYVKALFQHNRLVKGDFTLAGRPVRLDSVTCPLLLLVAEKDHLVPPESTLALAGHVHSGDVHSMVIGAGHVGLAVSSKAHRELWPDVASWIADHSTEL